MKRKYINRFDWTRVTKRRFKHAYVNNNQFKGYVAMLYIDKVKEPLIRNMKGKDIVLADNGFMWMQHLPDNSNYALTTMINEDGEIIQWYFDITKQNGIDERKGPFWDDLYLDVIVLPNSEPILVDEDELEDALVRGMITEDDFKLAYKEANRIMKGIAKDKEKLKQFTHKYLQYIQSIGD